MLVVVPTQIGSYFPGAIFFTFGAVCKSAAPFQSQGGATCLSNTRIKFPSRTPKIIPSNKTESPTRNLRTSSSLIGVLKRYSGISRSFLHFSVGPDFGAATFGSPALHIHGNRIASDVCPSGFNVNGERGRVSAQTLRADSG